MIPNLAGLSDLQRHAGKVFEPIKNGSDEIIFLTERNDIFGVSMSLEHYKALIEAAKQLEGNFWTSASETAMDFWNDKAMTSMKPCSNYKQGDIILIRFPFTKATELKIRPALVMCTPSDNDLTLLPISTKISLHRADLIIKKENYKQNPLPIESVVRISKITTVHKELAIKKVSELKGPFFKEVQLALFQYLSQ